MTKNVVALDWGTITESSTYFNVYLEEEGWKVYVSREEVSQVERETRQDQYLIAVLLAYVSYIRKSTSTSKGKICKLDDDTRLNAVTNLLNGYEHSIQSLINEVKDLKWHELRRVLLDSEPAEALYQTT